MVSINHVRWYREIIKLRTKWHTMMRGKSFIIKYPTWKWTYHQRSWSGHIMDAIITISCNTYSIHLIIMYLTSTKLSRNHGKLMWLVLYTHVLKWFTKLARTFIIPILTTLTGMTCVLVYWLHAYLCQLDDEICNGNRFSFRHRKHVVPASKFVCRRNMSGN